MGNTGNRFRQKKKKILIPILYNTKPELISPNNISFQQLLRKKHVSINLNLFNIYELIPALIPDHHIIDLPLNNDFLVDEPRLIDNVRESSGQKKIYVLIKHKDFDKSIIDAFKESVRELWNQDKESLRELDILMKNLLPLFWSNTCLAMSKIVLLTISKREHYTTIAAMIHNLMRDLFYRLSLRFFDKVSLSLVNNNKNKKIKLMLKEYSDYVFPQRGYDGGMNFLCHLYWQFSQPSELVKLSFFGPNIKYQTAVVNVNMYRDLISHYLPAVPLTEISELDWYKIIVPQFLSYEIMAKTNKLEPFRNSDIYSIGLRLEDYQTVDHT